MIILFILFFKAHILMQ